MLLNKKFVLLLALVSLFLCVITLQDTYAKYTSSLNETTNLNVARWRILVNDYDIKSNAATSNLITPVFAGTENISSGVIAPTATGYFDIIIDSTGTDLSFLYDISIANSEDSLVSDIVVKRCTLNEEDVSFTNNQVTGTISLSNPLKVNTLRVYIEWNDGDGSNMNNQEDTSVTLESDAVAKISVTARFIQTV